MNTIDALNAEAEKHRLIVKKIEALIRDLEEISRPQQELPLPAAQTPKAAEGQETTVARPFGKMSQIAAIETILRSKGQATTREIHEALKLGGIPVSRMAYISSVLSRTEDKFEHIGQGRKSKWRLVVPQNP